MDPVTDLADSSANVYENVKRLWANNQSLESVRDFYDKWSKDGNYDKQLREGYHSPAIATERLALYMGGKTDIKILDVGAGTGLVGEKLKTHGFTNVDALEPSDGMLAQAIEKKVYKKIFKIFFSENTDELESNKYDAIVSCGAFGDGHISPSVMPEFARIVKPGGLIVITSGKNKEESKIEGMTDELKKLENAGLVQCLELEDIPIYYYMRTGTLFVYKVT